MGIALWAAAGMLSFVTARLIPHGRPQSWIGEAFAAIAGAGALGVLATYFDFGGWREADWRAAALAACGALAVLGLIRVARLALQLRRI